MEEDDDIIYNVVFNLEEQYSIWPEQKELPVGWHLEGKSGTKNECIEYVEKVWKDFLPGDTRTWFEE